MCSIDSKGREKEKDNEFERFACLEIRATFYVGIECAVTDKMFGVCVCVSWVFKKKVANKPFSLDEWSNWWIF